MQQSHRSLQQFVGAMQHLQWSMQQSVCAMSDGVPIEQEQRQMAAEEASKAKQAAQQLLALAHSTGKVTEAYEVIQSQKYMFVHPCCVQGFDS